MLKSKNQRFILFLSAVIRLYPVQNPAFDFRFSSVFSVDPKELVTPGKAGGFQNREPLKADFQKIL